MASELTLAELPPRHLLEPRRVAALMDYLFGVSVDEAWAGRAAANVPLLKAEEGHWRAGWALGEHRLRYYGYKDEPLGPTQFGCSCRGHAGGCCEHVGALLIAMAWQFEEGRPCFERAEWELRLAPLLSTPRLAMPRREAADERWDGWVRYHLETVQDRGGPLGGTWQVRRELIRLGRRDGRELKPQRCPESMTAAEGRVRGVTQADHRFDELFNERGELIRLHRSRWQALSGRAAQVLRQVTDRMVLALADVGDVRLQGEAVTVSAAAMRPRISVQADGDRLALSWSPLVLRHLELGSGFVLVEGGVVCPLDSELSPGMRRALGRPLPQVPRSDVHRFLRTVVTSGKLPVVVGDLPELPIFRAEETELRLRLSEQGADLLVELRYAYFWGEQVIEVAPETLSELVTLEHDEGWLRRDAGWESAQAADLRGLLPEPLPLRLRGDEALDFLAMRAPELSRRFTLYGQQDLIKNRLRGTLKPRVQVPQGVDWFDLSLDFELDDQRISIEQVLGSWLAGRPYLRLEDGSLARLPEAWLRRHGQTAAELAELKRVRRGELGLSALPLVRDMVEESGQDLSPWTEGLDRLQELVRLPPRPPPERLLATLRDYQLQGYRWLCLLRELGLGACLADDMGLGKTLQALAMLLEGDRPGPSLVVAPTSVVDNWLEEAARFAPSLSVRLHHGPKRTDSLQALQGSELVITSYALLRQDRDLFEAARWTHVVLDEAQNIKNSASQVARVARALDAQHRVALTGTPVENDLHELRSIFDFLMPGFFGSRRAFTERYVRPARRQADGEAMARLRQRLRPFVLRRLKSQVAAELPERQQLVLRCELPAPQRALYEQVRDTYRASVLDRIAEQGAQRSKLHILEALTRLRQACCHPDLLPFDEARAVHGSAKVTLLLERLDVAIAEGHRCLVFSQWPSLLHKVAEQLEQRGWKHLLLEGATRNRGAMVKRWAEPDGPPVFLISLRAGGTGLNLTAADHVFLLDPWWNPAAEDQAIDRAHRIGQTRPVTVYRLVARDTVEESILTLQDKKRQLAAAALEDGELSLRANAGDALEQLLRQALEQPSEAALGS